MLFSHVGDAPVSNNVVKWVLVHFVPHNNKWKTASNLSGDVNGAQQTDALMRHSLRDVVLIEFCVSSLAQG